MAGLLRLETSFERRRLHLGYRRLVALGGPFAGPMTGPITGALTGPFTGHEFHYATTLRAEGAPLFAATDAEGARLPDMGLRRGRVAGSFAHVIDQDVAPG